MSRSPPCPCGLPSFYNEKYDAYACTEHGWLEGRCSDAVCEFCRDRPVDLPKIGWRETDQYDRTELERRTP